MKKIILWGVGCLLFVMGVLAGESLLTGEYTATISQSIKSTSDEGEPCETTGALKRAYLTFDDGPGALTEQYLDILKQYQVPATFFVIGSQVEQQPEVVLREVREGHEIGIHSYSHESGEIYQSADAYYQDVCQVQGILEKQVGYQAKLWRFPWGSANSYVSWFKQDIVGRLQQKNMEYADWNVSGEDSVGTPTVESIIRNVKKDCFTVEEPVILLHDSSSNQATLDSLEQIILMMWQEGYTFDLVSQRSAPCHFGT